MGISKQLKIARVTVGNNDIKFMKLWFGSKKKSKHCFAGSISTALHANGKNENNWGISRVLFTEVVRKKEVFGVSIGGVSAPNFVKSPVLNKVTERKGSSFGRVNVISL